MPDKIWNAASYTRLSRDDGDKAESNSITSQKEMIRDFIQRRDDLVIVHEYVDDGYSGVNFDRPGFKQMMEDIKAKKINCIICKDLSRFARNYIDSGRYLEKIFPFMGVRFIAINDNYDSSGEKSQSDSLIVAKNLGNGGIDSFHLLIDLSYHLVVMGLFHLEFHVSLNITDPVG